MKQVFIAVLAFCAASSFAHTGFAWDPLHVLDAGEGEVSVGTDYEKHGDHGGLVFNAGVSYGIIEGLEAAITFPFYHHDDETGFGQPALGVRYWLPIDLGFFANLALPFAGVGPDDLGLTVGVQYSAELTDELSIGSEINIGDLLSDGAKDLTIGLGLEHPLGPITLSIGSEFLIGIGDDAEKLGINPCAGISFDIGEMLHADVGVTLGFGDRYGDDMPVIISASVSLHF